jgi:hypothetical protein
MRGCRGYGLFSLPRTCAPPVVTNRQENRPRTALRSTQTALRTPVSTGSVRGRGNPTDGSVRGRPSVGARWARTRCGSPSSWPSSTAWSNPFGHQGRRRNETRLEGCHDAAVGGAVEYEAVGIDDQGAEADSRGEVTRSGALLLRRDLRVPGAADLVNAPARRGLVYREPVAGSAVTRQLPARESAVIRGAALSSTTTAHAAVQEAVDERETFRLLHTEVDVGDGVTRDATAPPGSDELAHAPRFRGVDVVLLVGQL